MSLHDDYIMMQNGFVEEIAPVLMGIGNVKGILLSGSHSKGPCSCAGTAATSCS